MTDQAKIDEIRRLVNLRKAEVMPQLMLNKKEKPPIKKAEIYYAIKNSDIGDAYLLSKLAEGELCFDPRTDDYYEYSGTAWMKKESGLPYHFIERLRDEYVKHLLEASKAANEARAAGDTTDKAAENLEKELRKHIPAIQRARTIESIFKVARSQPPPRGIAFLGEWDPDNKLLACPNAVIYLPTGFNVNIPKPEFYIRQATPTEWKGIDEPCPLWEDTVLKICSGNQNLYDYLQRLFGYCITGSTAEQKIPILYGPGGNGKTSLIKGLEFALGTTIVGALNVETLLRQRNPPSPSAPRADKLPLAESRILICPEPDENRSFAESELKQITGNGDRTVLRIPHASQQLSIVTHAKPVLLANYLPKFDGTSYAMQRRLLPIPLTAEFRPDPGPGQYHEIKNFSERLQSEASGILAWLVRGAILWYDTGLGTPPKVVSDAMLQYFSENDLMRQFATENLIFGPGHRAYLKTIHTALVDFCDQNSGGRPPGRNKFSKWLQENHNLLKDKDRNGWFFAGVSLLVEG